jgi:hypothetical protein
MATLTQKTGVQSVGSVASVSKAFASNVASGALIAVGGVTNGAVQPTNAVSDNLGTPTTYTRHVLQSGNQAAIFSGVTTVAGACTVTLDPTGSDFCSIAIAEFAPDGGNTWSTTSATRLDGTPVSGSGTASSVTATAITTAGTGCVVGVITHIDGTVSLAAGTGYTDVFTDTDATDMPICGIYKLTTAGLAAGRVVAGRVRPLPLRGRRVPGERGGYRPVNG